MSPPVRILLFLAVVGVFASVAFPPYRITWTSSLDAVFGNPPKTSVVYAPLFSPPETGYRDALAGQPLGGTVHTAEVETGRMLAQVLACLALGGLALVAGGALRSPATPAADASAATAPPASPAAPSGP